MGFGAPVRDDAGRRDDENRLALRAAAVFFGEDVGDGLQGFTEAHVVGEDAVEFVAGEELHPVEAGGLVLAELGLDAGGLRNLLDAGKVGELRGEFGEAFGGLDAKFLGGRDGGGGDRGGDGMGAL